MLGDNPEKLESSLAFWFLC